VGNFGTPAQGKQ
jgi:hypothetical protein